jgi:carbamoylphosphate synthase large subunit
VPYLLEVNARMSGGIQLSYAATGINIPNIAVNRLLGIEKRQVWDKTTRVVSFIETPILLR